MEEVTDLIYRMWLQRQYLEDSFCTFLVVCLGFLHSGDEGQFLQVLQDGQSSALLGQLLAVALSLSRELPNSDTGQEAFHVWRPALFQHLARRQDKNGCQQGSYT